MKLGILFFLPAIAWGANYYVDFASGSNAANGQTPQTAWKNLWCVNLATFSPGDFILLKRGNVWNERLTIPSAGTEALPVTVDAYGTGANPVIDGTGFALDSNTGLVTVNQSHVYLKNLEVRNSQRDGINAAKVAGFVVSDSWVHDNQFNGIYTWNASSVVIRTSTVSGNAIDTSASWAGIGIDGNTSLNSILIEDSAIFGNVGGSDVNTWNAGNGIAIGNASPGQLVITGLVITGNEIFDNGNKVQDQTGRGISASFTGDILITKNHIYTNASAGAYIGQSGQSIDIVISFNQFRNNALRQFGGFTQTGANCFENTMIIDQGNITAMGVEVGGAGPWVLTHNTFLYKAATTDIYRGYITLNDPAQDAVFQGVNNFYYSVSGSPERFRTSNGTVMNFSQWKATGYDSTSVKGN